MLRITLLVLSVLLGGCSSTTTLHLYAKYLTAEQTQQIEQHLKQQGYEVKVNQHLFPTSVNQSSLVYSPMLKHAESLDVVADSLASIDWNVYSFSPLVASNHWYTKNSIGVFLVPPGVYPHARSEVANLAAVYQAEACEQPIHVTLNPDRTYEISGVTHDEVYDWEKTGTWRVTEYPFLELRSYGDPVYRSFYFTVKQSTEVDKVSAIDITRLMPVEPYNIFGQCHFAAGIRV